MKRKIALVVALLVVAAAGVAGWLQRERIFALVQSSEDEHAEHDEDAHAGHAMPDAADPSDEPRVAIDVDPTQQARIGVRVASVRRQPVLHTMRAVGVVKASERLEAHVHTRISGYVERLHVDAVGDRVKRGQALYRLYSPEVVATEYEYAAAAGRGELSAMLAGAALERLALWDVPAAEIERLRRTKKPQRAIVFTSPVRGFVLEKNVLRGMYVTPEMELFHLADLSTVWIIVTLYEHELPVVAIGDAVTVSLAGLPDAKVKGTLSYIYPQVDLATRTAKARVEVKNDDFALKPGMYAHVTIEKSLGEALLVPDDAIIDTGVRSIVFVRSGAGRFEPREVEVGPRVDDGRVVRTGLVEGEAVVVRASFLIDVESRLQAALQRGAAPGGHAEHAGS